MSPLRMNICGQYNRQTENIVKQIVESSKKSSCSGRSLNYMDLIRASVVGKPKIRLVDNHNKVGLVKPQHHDLSVKGLDGLANFSVVQIGLFLHDFFLQMRRLDHVTPLLFVEEHPKIQRPKYCQVTFLAA